MSDNFLILDHLHGPLFLSRRIQELLFVCCVPKFNNIVHWSGILIRAETSSVPQVTGDGPQWLCLQQLRAVQAALFPLLGFYSSVARTFYMVPQGFKRLKREAGKPF